MPTQKPEEYLSHQAKFCGEYFYVNKDVLIPRPETEEIIDLVLRHPGSHRDRLLADVGAGCGCLGITLARKFPNSTVYLSDISEKALEVARKNATRREIILQSDLLANYPKGLQFDIIVANLPYIPTGRLPHLPSSVKDFEPHLALDGGKNGVEIINRLLGQLSNHLDSDGIAILEIDDTHTLKKFQIPNSMTGEITKDQFGKVRFLVLERSCTKPLASQNS